MPMDESVTSASTSPQKSNLGIQRLAGLLAAIVLATSAPLPGQTAESVSGWPYFREVSVEAGDGLAALEIDKEILGVGNGDGTDLRLYDVAGTEIPFALRVLRTSQLAEPRSATEYSRSTAGRTAELILKLGTDPDLHNQVQILTQGESYRRQVSVFGSDDAEEWTLLVAPAFIFRFAVSTGQVLVNRVRYPASRSPFLRIEVSPHDQTDAIAPVIRTAIVQMAIQVQGKEWSLPLVFGGPEQGVNPERPTSTYKIKLPGRLPVQAIRFKTPVEPFSRSFQLESIENDKIAPLTVAAGRLVRHETAASSDTMMRFGEVLSRELRLTVADDGSPPLELGQPVIVGAVRQLVVDLGAAEGGPLRLYYGNPAASSPEYKTPDDQPWSLAEDLPQLSASAEQSNPGYVPPAMSLPERAPWLVYVVLAVVCLALTAILRSLVWDVDGDSELSA
jgi:hypothetical protein